MATRSKSIQAQDKFIVRLPDGLRDKIGEVARETNRTMNAVVVTLLEAGLSQWSKKSGKGDAAKQYQRQAIAALNEIIAKATEARSSLSAKLILEMNG